MHTNKTKTNQQHIFSIHTRIFNSLSFSYFGFFYLDYTISIYTIYVYISTYLLHLYNFCCCRGFILVVQPELKWNKCMSNIWTQWYYFIFVKRYLDQYVLVPVLGVYYIIIILYMFLDGTVHFVWHFNTQKCKGGERCSKQHYWVIRHNMDIKHRSFIYYINGVNIY
jgi:hypothetical protein